ncbi:uncharacterized protein [Amphiura filiformis]|uniref:uncharacterized protein n=1 Tax=Amphiura filiformis TaxID=82378 RepID=UPI003B20DBDE
MPESSASLLVLPRLTGRPGRPRLNINPQHLQSLRDLNFSWEAIAKMFGTSSRTIRNRRRRDPQFQDLDMGYSSISDNHLDEILEGVLSISERSGETFMIGALRSRGYKIQRSRIRKSLQRVDPVGRALRRRRVIYRRSYRVPRPNYIWHIDGNHKLIDPWGFVIHGGIDGYSRLCVYLRCVTSNRASDVLTAFVAAVEMYGIPEHVRCDYGTENVEVARYMLEYKGLNRGSIITGLSTHNQRIERLWRDVVQCVCTIFAEVFAFMEAHHMADRNNPAACLCNEICIHSKD